MMWEPQKANSYANYSNKVSPSQICLKKVSRPMPQAHNKVENYGFFCFYFFFFSLTSISKPNISFTAPLISQESSPSVALKLIISVIQ